MSEDFDISQEETGFPLLNDRSLEAYLRQSMMDDRSAPLYY